MQRNDQVDESLGEYLTPSQVARLLQVPESTLAVWRCTGRVQLAYVKIGRAVRYRGSDLARFVELNSHGHAPI